MIKKVSVVLLVVLFALVWLAPIGPMPGFIIGGKESLASGDWGDTRDIHEVKLQVQGILPYVVIVWMVQLNGEIYVIGAKKSLWVKWLGESGDAKLRIEDKTFPVVANPVSKNAGDVVDAYYGKYRTDYPTLVEMMSSADAAKSYAIFRLSPRSL